MELLVPDVAGRLGAPADPMTEVRARALVACALACSAIATETWVRSNGTAESRASTAPAGARSRRKTWAPASASIMQVKGAGPIPASSMILIPLSGPLLIRPAPPSRRCG